MNITTRILSLMHSGLKSYGPSGLKRLLWNKEYSGDKWDFADNTIGDCVYSHLEKHSEHGSILDLGCGSGNTANEMDVNSFQLYVGVDISEECLKKAAKRAGENGRAAKTRFASGDFLSYVPDQQFDVILFRESMYHIPLGKIKSTLDRYAKYLKPTGLFVVRMATSDADGKPKSRPRAMFDIIEKEFEIVENSHYEDSGAVVIVFRPSRAGRE